MKNADDPSRKAYIAGLRELATFLEKHEEAPLPETRLIVYRWGQEDFLPAVKALGSCQKKYSDYYATASRMFGSIEYGVSVSRETVCTKRVVGTKTEPERYVPGYTVPEQQVDIVEWDCHPLLAEPQEAEKEPEEAEKSAF